MKGTRRRLSQKHAALLLILCGAGLARVAELLEGANISDGEVASWADEVRRQRKETAPWHYVNIPIDADGYDAKRDGNGGDNIIDAIERQSKVLADKQAPKEQRAEALKFVVHLIGDIHQPLHCGDRGDRGGNTRLVFFLDRKKAVSLHFVWDTLILPQSKGKQSVAEYATALNERVTSKQAKAWAAGTPLQWAMESQRVSREVVYAEVQADGDPPKLGAEYVAKAQPVVDEQIQKAGVRLGMTRNLAFR